MILTGNELLMTFWIGAAHSLSNEVTVCFEYSLLVTFFTSCSTSQFDDNKENEIWICRHCSTSIYTFSSLAANTLHI